MIDQFMGHIMVEGVFMKKTGIILALLMFSMTGLMFAQVEEGAICTILISGRVGESSPVTAEIRSFNNSGRLRIRVANRINNEDIEIVKVEVTGKNARGNTVTRSFTGSDIEMPEDYDGIVPRRDRVDIYK
jgi:hypothetical protein